MEKIFNKKIENIEYKIKWNLLWKSSENKPDYVEWRSWWRGWWRSWWRPWSSSCRTTPPHGASSGPPPRRAGSPGSGAWSRGWETPAAPWPWWSWRSPGSSLPPECPGSAMTRSSSSLPILSSSLCASLALCARWSEGLATICLGSICYQDRLIFVHPKVQSRLLSQNYNMPCFSSSQSLTLPPFS